MTSTFNDITTLLARIHARVDSLYSTAIQRPRRKREWRRRCGWAHEDVAAIDKMMTEVEDLLVIFRGEQLLAGAFEATFPDSFERELLEEMEADRLAEAQAESLDEQERRWDRW